MRSKFLLIVCCLMANLLSAQTAKIWDYPVKPGTEEWNALSTYDEMLAICQIPEDILKIATTEELVELCLNYPHRLGILYLYDNIQEGLERTSSQFNGLQELLGRKDNAQCLLALLKNSDLETKPIKILSTTGIDELIVRLALMEAFLSQKSVLANVSPEQQKEVARIAMKNMTLRERLPELSSLFHVEASAYLLCGSLKWADNNIDLSPNLEQFFNKGIFVNSAIVEELKQQYFQSFIK